MTYVCFMNIVYNLLKIPINHLKTHITLLSVTFFAIILYDFVLFFVKKSEKTIKALVFSKCIWYYMQ